MFGGVKSPNSSASVTPAPSTLVVKNATMISMAMLTPSLLLRNTASGGGKMTEAGKTLIALGGMKAECSNYGAMHMSLNWYVFSFGFGTRTHCFALSIVNVSST